MRGGGREGGRDQVNWQKGKKGTGIRDKLRLETNTEITVWFRLGTIYSLPTATRKLSRPNLAPDNSQT